MIGLVTGHIGEDSCCQLLILICEIGPSKVKIVARDVSESQGKVLEGLIEPKGVLGHKIALVKEGVNLDVRVDLKVQIFASKFHSCTFDYIGVSTSGSLNHVETGFRLGIVIETIGYINYSGAVIIGVDNC